MSEIQDGNQLRVMVVDDHPIWRDAVARDLGCEGVGDVVCVIGDGSMSRSLPTATRGVCPASGS